MERVPPIRRDFIRRARYLVPNSIVVTRGCPQHCDFCYKDAFFQGGRGFYTQRVDDALAEIERLPGRHLYFLDDHLLGDRRFAEALFAGMKGMRRLFQGAATVDSILRGDLIERAAEAGLRSIFVGFETLTPENLKKKQQAAKPGPRLQGRCRSPALPRHHDQWQFCFRHGRRWRRRVPAHGGLGHRARHHHGNVSYSNPLSRYPTACAHGARRAHADPGLESLRHPPCGLSSGATQAEALKAGYDWAYREFYRWGSIARASLHHGTLKHQAKHFFYASGWKKFEPAWDLLIRARQLTRVTPLLEGVLSRVSSATAKQQKEADAGSLPVILPETTL